MPTNIRLINTARFRLSVNSTAVILAVLVVAAGIGGFYAGTVNVTGNLGGSGATFTTTTTTTVTVPTATGTAAYAGPTTYYLHLNGVSTGVNILNYTDVVMLMSWGWSQAKTSCTTVMMGSTTCSSTGSSFEFTAKTSQASPQFSQYMDKGTLIPSATLLGVVMVGGQPVVVSKYDFTNSMMSSYSSGMMGSYSVDNVGMTFQMMTVVR